MPYILNIETATSACSVAVSDNGKVIFEKEELNGPSHATLLGVFVAEGLDFVREKKTKIDAVAVSCGPGSYTGLRIGVSEAKGLCYGLDVPLIALKTPEIMAKRVIDTIDIPDDVLLCPMIDARRMEVYAAIYDKDLNIVREIAADIVDENTYSEYLKKHAVYFFGNGSDKCRSIIHHQNAQFIEDIYPSAHDMIQLADLKYEEKQFEDVAYFEPFYLKDFVTTTPKKNIF